MNVSYEVHSEERVHRYPNRPFHVILLALALSLLGGKSHCAESYLVGSSWSVTVSDVNDSPTASGEVIRVERLGEEPLFVGAPSHSFFCWSAGGSQAATGVIRHESNGELRIHYSQLPVTEHTSLPVNLTMMMRGVAEGLQVKVELTVNTAVRFNSGVWCTVPLDASGWVDFVNSAGAVPAVMPPDSGRRAHIPYQSLADVHTLYGNFRLVFPQPLAPTPVRVSEGLRLELLTSSVPNVTAPSGGGNFCSILEPGDTVRCEWVILPPRSNEKSLTIATFSSHPNSAPQSIYFAFDDIPSLETRWGVPTDASNSHTPITSNLLGLLDDFPTVKYTWLILTDGIQRLGNWYFPGWWPPTNNTLPNRTIVLDGNASLELSQTDGNRTTKAVFNGQVPVTPESPCDFRGYYYSEAAANTVVVAAYQWPDGTLLAAKVLPTPTNGWAAFDLSFRNGGSGVVTLYTSFQASDGSAYFDRVSCIDSATGGDVVLNGGFEEFEPYLQYDAGFSDWPHVRGNNRLATHASQSYLSWLRGAQDGVAEWKYNDRVGLGLHGMHHTPSIDFGKNGVSVHEFNYYDPVGDSVRMAQIVNDLTTCGLDSRRICSFFRFPGHRHTESLLHPILKAGVRVYDQGALYEDFWAGRILREHKTLWQTGDAAWFDQELPVASFRLGRNQTMGQSDALQMALDAGMFALIGAHYHLFGYVASPEAIQRARNLFAGLEGRYPDLHWFKGEEIANFWDELDQIHDIRQVSFTDPVAVSWEGASTLGETIILYQDEAAPVRVTIDGTPAATKVRNGRTFITLPALGSGKHQLTAVSATPGQPPVDDTRWTLVPEGGNAYRIGRIVGFEAEVSVNFADAMGRYIGVARNYRLGRGDQRIAITLPPTASGAYFVVIEESGSIVSLPLVRVH